ncbi:MAG: hypothetical protein IJ568_01155 [Bacilli bacterium]|nr:hypothetical protein [Bacilli bacterium]
MNKIVNKIMSLGVIAGLLLEVVPIYALSKDETIYAKLDNNGQVSKVIISEHLEDTNDGETEDKTRLSNIKNINGDEEYILKDGKIIWKTKGMDIYYQGTTEEELPINLDVKYYLNNEEMSISDMLGKSGTVKMVLKFSNNEKHYMIVNGKNELLYTPFVVATTTILSNTTNKNIKVTNGRVVKNGTSSVVVALTTPGLYESMHIDKLKGMDTCEITYETSNFELSSIYSVATSKLIDSTDFDVFDKIDSLYGSINTLVSSSNKIKNGSSELLNGASKLKDGVSKLKDGISSSYLGSKQIRDSLQSSINMLQNDSSEAIDSTTLSYIKNEAVNGAKEVISSKFTDEYKAQIAALALSSLSQNETYQKLKGGIKKLEEAGVTKELVSSCSVNQVDEALQQTCMNYANYIKEYSTYLQMITLMEETAKQTAVSTAINVSGTVAEQTASMVSESVAVKVAESAKEKAKSETTKSLNTLLQAISELTSGLNQLNLGAVELDNGTLALKDGISSLDSGISQFNNEGISKISNVVNGDVKSLEERVKALVKLSDEYNTFDDKADNTKGESKIIMVIDAVKAPSKDVIVNDKIIEEEKSLWDKIKGLFK